jgi:hypothetical protein
MQGNLAAITGLSAKLKSVILKRMGGTDSADKRKELIG